MNCCAGMKRFSPDTFCANLPRSHNCVRIECKPESELPCKYNLSPITRGCLPANHQGNKSHLRDCIEGLHSTSQVRCSANISQICIDGLSSGRCLPKCMYLQEEFAGRTRCSIWNLPVCTIGPAFGFGRVPTESKMTVRPINATVAIIIVISPTVGHNRAFRLSV